MKSRRPIPVIVGVGDITNRSPDLKDSLEPLELILKAINLALQDTGITKSANIERLQHDIDSISIVQTWTWPYPDLPGLVADRLDAKPQHKYYSDHGGNQPAKLLDEASRRIALGQSKVAIVTGGEALASLTAFAKAGKLPPPGWTKPDREVGSVFSPTTQDLEKGLGAAHSIGAPIQVYPLYENGFRAHRGQSIQDNHRESAQLYAEFANVAEQNKYSWNSGKPSKTAEEIGGITEKNRMICSPYPLLMNAFNTVDLAAACLLMSAESATQMGIPKDKWIFPLGGAGTRDSYDFWERPNYHSSPAISHSIDTALKVCALERDEIDIFDFYSCFPIVPKLACTHLGMPILSPATAGGVPSKPITLLGGLTSFGGAGNNYSMHAMTEMTRRLRQRNSSSSSSSSSSKNPSRKRTNGLVLANGGCLTYQHVVCLSSQSPMTAYPENPPLPEFLTQETLGNGIVPTVDAEAEGDAIIETYTVQFDRANRPVLGHVVGRLVGNNHRFLANHGDDATLVRLAGGGREEEEEMIGKRIVVKKDGRKRGRNTFVFKRDVKDVAKL